MTKGNWKDPTVRRKYGINEYLRVKYSSAHFLYSIRKGNKSLKISIELSEANNLRRKAFPYLLPSLPCPGCTEGHAFGVSS